jgi:hypothetical protein
MLALLAILGPRQSQAQYDPTHVYQIINAKNGWSLEVPGDSPGAGQTTSLSPYTGKASQQWKILSLGNGMYQLVNRNTNMAIEPSGSGSQAYWAQAYPGVQTPFSSTNDGHKWIIRNRANSALKTITSFKTGLSLSWQRAVGKSLTDPNALPPEKLSQNVDFGDDATGWGIIDQSANYYGQPSGSSFLIVNRYNGMVMGSFQGNNGVNSAQYRQLAGQQWTFSPYNSDGFLTITNRQNQQVLEMGNGGDNGELGHNANLYQYWGGANQQWILQDINDSHTLTVDELYASSFKFFKIYNRYSGKVLQVAGSGNDLYREGQSVNQWESLGHPWQQWYIMVWGNNRLAAPGTPEAATIAQDVEVNVYPNPVHDRLTLSGLKQTAETTISVVDMSGKAASAYYEGDGVVNVSRLAAGLYIITIKQGQQEYHRKFSKI